jgi:hypothetical protein
VETVRVWHSLYGGIEDDEYVARMLDDTFTIRGLENYVWEAAENLDPKKNRYVQAVLRAQGKGRVDARALHEEVKDITEASLRKAQALAILDAQAVMPATPYFAFPPNEKPKACPTPNSPNSVVGFDMIQLQHQMSSRKMNSFDKKLLEHMDEDQRRKIIIEHRRNSMQLYQAEERRKSELQNHRRLSISGGVEGGPRLRRQSLSGVPSTSYAPLADASSGHDLQYSKMMMGQRDSLAMDQQRLSTAATRQPTSLKQHPRPPASLSYPRDSMSLGPRPIRKHSMTGPQTLAYASHARRADFVGASYHQQQQQQQQLLQYPHTMEGRMFPVNQQQRRDSVYGTMITTPQSMALVQMQRSLQRDPSTYTEMIGGFPGMRRDSLAGHYEHS